MKKKAKDVPFCDWQTGPSRAVTPSVKSTVYKYKGNYRWRGVRTEAYKEIKGDWDKIIRKVLIGEGLKAKSHLRYFEIAPGGKSSFERHRHEHIVIGVRGKGKVILDNMSYKIGFLDVVYVSSNTPHQFTNPFDEPFGFICVVPAKRDKPVLISR
jgi:quercetin dioxygenase-like cupin family protein